MRSGSLHVCDARWDLQKVAQVDRLIDLSLAPPKPRPSRRCALQDLACGALRDLGKWRPELHVGCPPHCWPEPSTHPNHDVSNTGRCVKVRLLLQLCLNTEVFLV